MKKKLRAYIYNTYRWVFARPIFRKFNMVTFQLSLNGLGVLNYENNKVSGESYFIEKVLPQIVTKREPVFFDIGANVGNYTLSLLNSYPNAQVHAFEPHPENFLVLKKNIEAPNVKAHNLALSENTGRLKLYDRADCKNGSSHASLHERVISEIHKKDVLEFSVSVYSLDDFCKKEKIKEIDFVKIDTEGNELAVLNGADNIFAKCSIKCIHVEFNEMNVVSRCFFKDFRKKLNDYNIYRLLPKGMILLDDSPVFTELFAYQNIIAILKSADINV